MNFAYQIATFFIRLRRYRAGVYNRNIGILIGAYTHKSTRLELSCEGRTLRKIELATKCMEINFSHSWGKDSKKLLTPNSHRCD